MWLVVVSTQYNSFDCFPYKLQTNRTPLFKLAKLLYLGHSMFYFLVSRVCLSAALTHKDEAEDVKYKMSFLEALTVLFPGPLFSGYSRNDIKAVVNAENITSRLQNCCKCPVSLDHDSTVGAAILDFNKLYQHGAR